MAWLYHQSELGWLTHDELLSHASYGAGALNGSTIGTAGQVNGDAGERDGSSGTAEGSTPT
jgi:hypothetical protein